MEGRENRDVMKRDERRSESARERESTKKDKEIERKDKSKKDEEKVIADEKERTWIEVEMNSEG